jgi:transcriptional regulator
VSFVPLSPAEIGALIRDHPLAWVVSGDRDATLLPLIAECGADGTPVALVGHYPRRNPQLAAFERDPQALILFRGPEGYVSPRLVSNPTWGATWNYAALRIVATLAFVPEETEDALRRLAAQLEPAGGWRPEQMGARFDELARHVVAFRARIVSCEPQFKLGQDERAATFAEIVAGHSDAALVAAMRRNRPDDAS